MDAKRKNKALVLWRELAERSYSLDIEAIDALTLRDELEIASLTADEWRQVHEMDRTVLESRLADIVRDLERTGVLPTIKRLREEKSKFQWWWWLDYRIGTP